MRNVVGSLNNSAAGTASQFQTTEKPRVFSATFRARTANSGQVYIAGSSALSSADGFELNAGESFDVSYADRQVGSVKGTNFWMLGTDTSQKCDYWIVTED